MDKYLKVDPWKIIEDGFHPERNRVSESIFSIGNGRFGQRANFEETYTGDSLLGNYIGGVYYPDKTRVGWWKNGYPEYFAKVLNAVNWTKLRFEINDQELDLNKCELHAFRRELDMKEGVLRRSFAAELPDGQKVRVESERFCSIHNDKIACLRYVLTAEDDIKVYMGTALDFDVVNEDSNYDEKFWTAKDSLDDGQLIHLSAATKKLDFEVHVSSLTDLNREIEFKTNRANNYISQTGELELKSGDSLEITKYVAIAHSIENDKSKLSGTAQKEVRSAQSAGYDTLKSEHIAAWESRWSYADVNIQGDDEAVQALRFNIFQLFQTYTGEYAHLNIGPKGFTGEKYGGSTYWDTEAYCLPFFLYTAPKEVSKQLLQYRFNHLEKAIENAAKLGFNKGAALYPMVTMNGEECHNEWEITFEEIHRNGAIAHAIYNYTKHTGDTSYLEGNGIEVLVGIARFWAQRVNFSEAKNKFVMLGVTGPNEYENNVNNNWHTNNMARWCWDYTLESLASLDHDRMAEVKAKLNLTTAEFEDWANKRDNIYLPEAGLLKLQQDGFLDKELMPADDIPSAELPIHEHWSWDRILRSCFIKQADVLQSFYFFRGKYSEEELSENFAFYEPMTVHDSSLSACVHTILASDLGLYDKAYELYLRTARLDLDNYNNDTRDGLHITAMAGAWLSVVEGFAGARILDGTLELEPHLPEKWEGIQFNLLVRDAQLRVEINREHIRLHNQSDEEMEVLLYGEQVLLAGKEHLEMAYVT